MTLRQRHPADRTRRRRDLELPPHLLQPLLAQVGGQVGGAAEKVELSLGLRVEVGGGKQLAADDIRGKEGLGLGERLSHGCSIAQEWTRGARRRNPPRVVSYCSIRYSS